MRPALVYNKNLEILGAVHNWRLSIAVNEMSRLCLLLTDSYFSPKEALTGRDLNCAQCESFDKCYPKLLVKLPEKEEA